MTMNFCTKKERNNKRKKFTNCHWKEGNFHFPLFLGSNRGKSQVHPHHEACLITPVWHAQKESHKFNFFLTGCSASMDQTPASWLASM